MKTIALICSFICLGHLGFAQSKFIDSLSKQLSIATDDKSKVLLLSEIGYYYRLSKGALQIKNDNFFIYAAIA